MRHREQHATWVITALLGLTVASACKRADHPPPVSQRDTASQVDGGRVPLRFPSDSAIPDGALGVSIRRGRALLANTRDSLPTLVGNQLQCVSCHPLNGTKANAMPWVGVYGRFPQYRARSGTVQVIEDRITDCFERSMDGRAPAWNSREMRDMVAYFAFLSQGVPVGAEVQGQGLPRLEPLPGDSARGAALFAAQCVHCHGADGTGTAIAPSLWGPNSYNIGAGMARLRTAASFIRYNMPADRPGTLTDQQAFDLAHYINSHPRPDFKLKHLDWPNGDPPPDVAYDTDAARRKRSAAQ
ncbi:MAG TPA: c-type cytochrome [Gemmatimonadaceae bacterium]|nr:c-type cytochrome [Gemmatimonadaceae bacterium]